LAISNCKKWQNTQKRNNNQYKDTFKQANKDDCLFSADTGVFIFSHKNVTKKQPQNNKYPSFLALCRCAKKVVVFLFAKNTLNKKLINSKKYMMWKYK